MMAGVHGVLGEAPSFRGVGEDLAGSIGACSLMKRRNFSSHTGIKCLLLPKSYSNSLLRLSGALLRKGRDL